MEIMTKEIQGFNGRYLISNDGVVTSVYRYAKIHGVMVKISKQKILKPGMDSKGYLVVGLFNGDGVQHSKRIHRLVAEAFLENPENKRCVCHKDNNPQNNNVDNLYWGTDQENIRQAFDDGLHKNKRAVMQISKTGEIVNTFCSMREASNKTGIQSQSIWGCVVGRKKTAGGYIWKDINNAIDGKGDLIVE